MAAKKDGLVVPITTDADELKKGFEQAAKIVQSGGKSLEKEAAKMALAVSKKIETLSPKSQARQLETLTIKMMEMGMQGTKAFEMVASSAAHLKANIDDAKGIIDAMRPDAPFQALSTTLGASAQAFAGVQGAMALFGAESEDLQKTLLKVQAAMAFAEGFKAIDGLSDGFQQLSIIMKARVIPAITSFIGSMSLMKTAMITSGAGVFLVAIGAIVNGLSEAEDQAKATADALDDVRFANDANFRQMMTDIEILDELNKKAGKSDKEIYEAKISWIDDYIDKLQQQQRWAKDDKINAQIKDAYQQRYKIASDFEDKLEKLREKKAKKVSYTLPKVEQQKELSVGFDYSKATDMQFNFIAGQYELIKTAPIVTSKMDELTKGLQVFTPNTQAAVAQAEKLQESLKSVIFTAADLNELLEKSLENTIYNMAAAFGEAASTGEDAAQAIGKAFLVGLADFLQQMGKMMITAGVTWAAFQANIAANPIAAAALGVAAVAAGAALKSHIAKGAQIEKFAEGGIVAGTSYSGDRVHALVNSGEMILNHQQQSRLFNMLNTGGTNNGYIASTRIDGRDLYLVVEKAKKDMSR